MNEQEAFRKLDFQQSVHYDQDVIDIYFDVVTDDGVPYCSDNSQAFYKTANITTLVDWEVINEKINWRRVKEEQEDY